MVTMGVDAVFYGAALLSILAYAMLFALLHRHASTSSRNQA